MLANAPEDLEWQGNVGHAGAPLCHVHQHPHYHGPGGRGGSADVPRALLQG